MSKKQNFGQFWRDNAFTIIPAEKIMGHNLKKLTKEFRLSAETVKIPLKMAHLDNTFLFHG